MAEELDQVERRVKAFGLRVVERRIARLEGRKLVLFPFLRARLLLRKIQFLKA